MAKEMKGIIPIDTARNSCGYSRLVVLRERICCVAPVLEQKEPLE